MLMKFENCSCLFRLDHIQYSNPCFAGCAKLAGLQLKPLESCYKGEKGRALDAKAHNETDQLSPKHTYVPWVSYILAKASPPSLSFFLWLTTIFCFTVLVCLQSMEDPCALKDLSSDSINQASIFTECISEWYSTWLVYQFKCLWKEWSFVIRKLCRQSSRKLWNRCQGSSWELRGKSSDLLQSMQAVILQWLYDLQVEA